MHANKVFLTERLSVLNSSKQTASSVSVGFNDKHWIYNHNIGNVGQGNLTHCIMYDNILIM